MGKGYKITMILLMIAVVAGCSSEDQKKIQQMDFQAKMEWKAPEPIGEKRPKILFVGNSHTFYNDLAGTFVRIVDACGQKSDVYELSKGYYSLARFANTEDELGNMLDKAIHKRKWDFVIFQENVAVVLSPKPEEEMFPYARTLNEKVEAEGGHTVFLMTWAPKNGKKEGFKTQSREELQTVIAENYMTISEELNALLIPAGISFMRCVETYPDIELWDADGQHPSPAGTYLAACTAFAVMYQQSPENCSYTADLDEEMALKLQKIAAELILG
ncbi:DUF4886 domain-containing protein [Candidatus Ventrimonas sp. KK005]|nr:hypothetical protein [Lachnospiraceae bacterium]